MVNFTRRQRQAGRNVDHMIHALVDPFEGGLPLSSLNAEIPDTLTLDRTIALLEARVSDAAYELEPDWTIPVLLETVGNLYYGDYTRYNDFGLAFKRALPYLWKNVFKSHGDKKNLGQLAVLVRLCFTLEILYAQRKSFLICPGFHFEVRDGRPFIPAAFQACLNAFNAQNEGKGRRLRVAQSNSSLMNEHPKDFLDGLFRVVHGEAPASLTIFQNTFYEKIPGVENEACQAFWQELLFRYSFYLGSYAAFSEGGSGTEVLFFPTFHIGLPEPLLTEELVLHSFWRTDWFELQNPERYGNLIVDRPILRISPDGDYATSPVLLGDSINQFVERQIFNYATKAPGIHLPDRIFKDAFSEAFEQMCIDLFRGLGFEAGHVTEAGIWKTQHSNISLTVEGMSLYGEIDVLALHPGTMYSFLIECKVLNDAEDTRTFRNLYTKLNDDSEGFRSKLLKKSEWVKAALSAHYGLPIEPMVFLLTDIPMPLTDFDDDRVLYASFGDFKETLQEVCRGPLFTN